MKVYCQFKVLSTGYISGTIPPQYNEDNKKPIDMLGSEGVYILDGRNSLSTLISDSILRKDKMRRTDIVGFEIIKSDNFLNEGKVIYKSELLF